MGTTKTNTALKLNGAIKPSTIVDFSINHNDNCFTAIMRAINKPELIDKYRGSLHVFMNAYRKQLHEVFGVNELDSEKYGELKSYGKPLLKGHILVLNNKITYGNPFKGRFSVQYGVITEDFEVRSNGHMMLCLDPEKNLFLHMKSHECCGLVLSVHEIVIERYKKTNHVILDSRVIETM
jgi:hypothetical protein